jgi:uncharacterized protein (DUF2147 family)
MTKRLILLCGVSLLAGFVAVTGASERIAGRWLTANGEGWVDIRLQGGVPAGFIAGSPQDLERRQPHRLDVHNPDPALRDRPLHGMQIISGMNRIDSNRWKGLIYDPNSGKTYNCTLSMVDDNTLRLRGYVGISLFGRTETWTRIR